MSESILDGLVPDTILDDLGFHAPDPESVDLSDWVIDEDKLGTLPQQVLAKLLPPAGSLPPHIALLETSEDDPFLTPQQVAAIKIWELRRKAHDQLGLIEATSAILLAAI